jgi:hypothetical protein
MLLQSVILELIGFNDQNLGRHSAIEGSNFVKKSSMSMRKVKFSPIRQFFQV